MTYYIGRDYLIYEKKINEVFLSLAKEMEQKGIKVYRASTFRFMIDKLHNTLKDSKKKGVET